MSVLDLFVVTKAENDVRFRLAAEAMAIDEGEHTNQPLHARNDGRRFAAMIELHKASYDASQQNKTLLLLITAFLVITQTDKIIAFVKLFL